MPNEDSSFNYKVLVTFMLVILTTLVLLVVSVLVNAGVNKHEIQAYIDHGAEVYVVEGSYAVYIDENGVEGLNLLHYIYFYDAETNSLYLEKNKDMVIPVFGRTVFLW